jgi:hypothetical protein
MLTVFMIFFGVLLRLFVLAEIVRVTAIPIYETYGIPDRCTGTRADLTDITREERNISESENTQSTMSG